MKKTTIIDLRNTLVTDYNAIRTGRMKLPAAKESTAKANAIISCCKVELSYFAQRKEAPQIPFLDGMKRIKARVLPVSKKPLRLSNGK